MRPPNSFWIEMQKNRYYKPVRFAGTCLLMVGMIMGTVIILPFILIEVFFST